jgi:hypothetical protein
MSDSSQDSTIAIHDAVGALRPSLPESRGLKVDVDALTERVYRLLADELRLESERRGWLN